MARGTSPTSSREHVIGYTNKSRLIHGLYFGYSGRTRGTAAIVADSEMASCTFSCFLSGASSVAEAEDLLVVSIPRGVSGGTGCAPGECNTGNRLHILLWLTILVHHPKTQAFSLFLYIHYEKAVHLFYPYAYLGFFCPLYEFYALQEYSYELVYFVHFVMTHQKVLKNAFAPLFSLKDVVYLVKDLVFHVITVLPLLFEEHSTLHGSLAKFKSHLFRHTTI